jgi:hypothetical protein
MTTDYAYTGLTLNGRFSDDGELLLLSLDLNGVPIKFGNIYVGDQREAFQEAKDAGQPKEPEAEPAAAG